MSKPVLAVVVLLWTLGSGCAPRTKSAGSTLFRMGERVQVGQLIYTVLDTEWMDQLGNPPDLRIPRHRFMAVRVSVTNSGATTSGVPAMVLIDNSGVTHAEVNDGTGLTDWLGYLRIIKPADTLHGRVLFDAPAASYRMRLSNDADPDEAKVANVEIPLDLSNVQSTSEMK
jgi:hypothetical protein